jgi:hypothetical protein
MLSREEMQTKSRGPVKTLPVPEWGGDIGIRKLSAGDLLELRRLAKPDGEDPTDEDNLTAICEVVSLGVCDTDGRPCFSIDDIREWAGDQMPLLYRLVDEIQIHNGMAKSQREELEKNSESGPI